MPINYPQSNWIQPADPAANYGKGFGLGLQAGHAQAQIAMERARLAEAQNRTAVTLALEQQKIQRESMVDQQKLEVAKAYHEQQGALKAQELEMKQQALQEKVKEAAARSLAMERFKNQIQQPGADLVRSYIENFAGLEHGAGMGTAFREFEDRSNPAKVPKVHKLQLSDGTFVDVIAGPGGNPHSALGFMPKTPVLNPDRATTTLNTLLNISPDMMARRGLDTNSLPSLQKMALDRVTAGFRGVQPAGGGAAPQQEVLPYPKSKEDAVKGKLYQTKWGVSEWTGDQWRPLNPVTETSPAAEPASEDNTDLE